MATTLRIELQKAGFTVGGVGTTLVAQDYGPNTDGNHAKITGSHVIGPTDPILDLKFANGYEWLGYRPICAYDANYLYMIVNLPYQHARFQKFALSPGQISGAQAIPHITERFRDQRDG